MSELEREIAAILEPFLENARAAGYKDGFRAGAEAAAEACDSLAIGFSRSADLEPGTYSENYECQYDGARKCAKAIRAITPDAEPKKENQSESIPR